MGAQPVGAMGKELGTYGIVALQLEIDDTGQNLEISCYVCMYLIRVENCASLNKL